MSWGVPLLGNRVAPRCTRADGLLLALVSRGRVVSHATLSVPIQSLADLLSVLARHGVSKLVCGGVNRELREALASQAVSVVENVACSVDEVLAALDSGSLCPGYGFAEAGSAGAGAIEAPAADPEVPPAEIDCLACNDRVCLLGLACSQASGLEAATIPGDYGRLLEAATDIAREEERTLCRLAEVVYFCLEMRFRRVGLAFCVDLLEPSRILAGVLRRFFEVVPVCCKVGGVSNGDLESAPCNPLGQAAALNAAKTDVNVTSGLCVGADCVFNQASHAPVTTLFVKDKSLANNPIGALYSERYLRESINPSPGLTRADVELDWGTAPRASALGSNHRETRS
jgi:uncharacterized metal-binding protein